MVAYQLLTLLLECSNTSGCCFNDGIGADGVFVGSGIFKSEDPEKFAKAIVQATTHYQDYELIGKLAAELGTAMKGLDINKISLEERMQERGW